MPPDPPDRPGPHDALFRRVLGEPEHAASELRSVLPPALFAALDLDGMTQVAGSFVDEELRWRHCDLLFATRSRGRDAFVYVLVEHQSSSDRWMALRARPLTAPARVTLLLLGRTAANPRLARELASWVPDLRGAGPAPRDRDVPRPGDVH